MYVHDFGRVVTEGGNSRLSDFTDCHPGFPELPVKIGYGNFTFVESVHSSQLPHVYLNIFSLAGGGTFQFRSSEPVTEVETRSFYTASKMYYKATHVSSKVDRAFDGYMTKLKGKGWIGYGFNTIFVELDFGDSDG